MTYKLSQAADSDLYALYIEGIEEHGILQADKYYDELMGALDLLGRSINELTKYESRRP